MDKSEPHMASYRRLLFLILLIFAAFLLVTIAIYVWVVFVSHRRSRGVMTEVPVMLSCRTVALKLLNVNESPEIHTLKIQIPRPLPQVLKQQSKTVPQ